MPYKVPKTKKCAMCGQAYETTAPNGLYCLACRHAAKIAKEKNGKKERRKQTKNRSNIAAKSIAEMVSETLAYNEQHGTHLTYGRYVAMLEQEL